MAQKPRIASPAAVAPDAVEKDALVREAERLAPMLGRVEAAAGLAPLLKAVGRARALGADGFGVLKDLAARLRDNGAFADLYVLCSEMRASGLEDRDVRRWEAQALIALGVHETALTLARRMIVRGPASEEGQDGYALLGRAYREMYLAAVADGRRQEPQLVALYLERAFAAYNRVWETEKSAATAWFAVSAAAIARRAAHDDVSGAEEARRALQNIATKLAQDVVRIPNSADDAWTRASRGEALIALERYEEAAGAYAAHTLRREVTLHQLDATLGELEELWQISGEDKKRGASVRLLKAMILSRHGGGLKADNELAQTAAVTLTPKELQLLARETAPRTLAAQRDIMAGADRDPPAAANDAPGETDSGYESLLAIRAPLDMQIVRNALTRAKGVCRIHANIDGRDRPVAAGFAIEGRLLHEGWGPDPVIVTCSHAVSTRPGRNNQTFEACEALFMLPDADEPRRIPFAAVLWESDPEAHDITVLKPAAALPDGVQPLKDVARKSLPPHAVNDDGVGRICVIGVPEEGDYALTLADNLLLDHDAPRDCIIDPSGRAPPRGLHPEPIRMHYRTSPDLCASGSPVFDVSDYSLVGVHQRGRGDSPRLNNREGCYVAGEGVWIESIRAAIAESEAETASHPVKRWRSYSREAEGPAEAPTPVPVASTRLVPQAPASGPRIFPGSTGEMSAGFSPVAAQILRTGKATPAEAAAAASESIIGLDDRTRIFETAMAPWRMIVAIRCWWGTRIAVGTGALISPNTILTAAHILMPRGRPVVPDRIEIIPGLHGPQQPYGIAPAASLCVHPRWAESFDLSADVAAIHLTQPIGHKIGWFGTAWRTAEELRGTWVHVSGYPGENLEATDPATGRPVPPLQSSQLWHHSAPIINVQNNRIFYAADTTPGQSGAPLHIVEPAFSPTPVIVGVHAYGRTAAPTAIGPCNSGAWIDEEMFEIIAQWRAESEAVLAGAPTT